MKKRKNQLDEMQEQKLLQIEHNGCWLAFWGLLIAMFVQAILYGPGELKTLAGEWIVFMCLALYICFGCMKNGIWDRWLTPTPSTNLIMSLVAGGILGALQFFVSYRRYHMFLGSIAAGVFILLIGFSACFAGLSLSAALYTKKIDKIENEEEKEEENQDERKHD